MRYWVYPAADAGDVNLGTLVVRSRKVCKESEDAGVDAGFA